MEKTKTNNLKGGEIYELRPPLLQQKAPDIALVTGRRDQAARSLRCHRRPQGEGLRPACGMEGTLVGRKLGLWLATR